MRSRRHALTHAHPDHQGASKEITEKLGIPFWCPEKDVPAAEDEKLIAERQPDSLRPNSSSGSSWGRAAPLTGRSQKATQVGSFEVVDAPGHSAGQVAFWRDSDKVLILGDVLANIDQYSGLPGLHKPKPALTPDPAMNRDRRASSPSSSRSSSASGTARSCATPRSSPTSWTVSQTRPGIE